MSGDLLLPLPYAAFSPHHEPQSSFPQSSTLLPSLLPSSPPLVPSSVIHAVLPTIVRASFVRSRMLANCTYRYDLSDDVIRALSLYLDGPFTLVAAILALIGGHFAVKFLGQAGLNRDLTAALYTLCSCDAFLIFMVMLYHSIEATGILVAGRNIMWNDQKFVLYTHGFVSAATTASTLLVVFITFQRFLVVIWPLRYARVSEHKRTDLTLRRTSSTETGAAIAVGGDTSNSTLLSRTVSQKFFQPRKKSLSMKKRLRPYIFPVFVVVFAFLLNSTVFFEFELVDCFVISERKRSKHLFPTALRQNQTYNVVRTVVMLVTQTVGPISFITFLTVITEYKVQLSLKARRCLFESQHRRRSLVMVEEMRERLSRTVAIFIAVKFLILRSLPIFFDIYETFYGIESFGIVLSILVRLSDFGVVLNAATNSLAYFGKTRWLEMRLRDRLLKKRQTLSGSATNCSTRSRIVTAPKPSFDLERKKSSSATMAERSSPISPPPTSNSSRPPSAPPLSAALKAARLVQVGAQGPILQSTFSFPAETTITANNFSNNSSGSTNFSSYSSDGSHSPGFNICSRNIVANGSNYCSVYSAKHSNVFDFGYRSIAKSFTVDSSSTVCNSPQIIVTSPPPSTLDIREDDVTVVSANFSPLPYSSPPSPIVSPMTPLRIDNCNGKINNKNIKLIKQQNVEDQQQRYSIFCEAHQTPISI